MRVTASLAATFVLCLPAAAFAATPPDDSEPADEEEEVDDLCSGGSDVDDVLSGCVSGPSGGDVDDPVVVDPCPDVALTWQVLNSYSFIDPNVQFGDGYRYYPEGGQAMRETPDGEVEYGILQMRWNDALGDCEPSGFYFVPDATPEPDPVEVSIDEARERVPEPELDISPSLTAGGVVNLGMWLSVSNSDDVSATANGRGTSVTATATLVETSWDMGDGTTVPCADDGEAIDPNSDAFDSVEEGPCGHTYTQPGAFTITVTATWEVTWAATDGRSGTAPPIIQTASFAYDVVEIQTVGTNN